MAEKKLFEYAVFKNEQRAKDGTVSDEAAILIQPTVVLAKDIGDVNVLAARAIPEEQVANLDRITIAVRPF